MFLQEHSLHLKMWHFALRTFGRVLKKSNRPKSGAALQIWDADVLIGQRPSACVCSVSSFPAWAFSLPLLICFLTFCLRVKGNLTANRWFKYLNSAEVFIVLTSITPSTVFSKYFCVSLDTCLIISLFFLSRWRGHVWLGPSDASGQLISLFLPLLHWNEWTSVRPSFPSSLSVAWAHLWGDPDDAPLNNSRAARTRGSLEST